MKYWYIESFLFKMLNNWNIGYYEERVYKYFYVINSIYFFYFYILVIID